MYLKSMSLVITIAPVALAIPALFATTILVVGLMAFSHQAHANPTLTGSLQCKGPSSFGATAVITFTKDGVSTGETLTVMCDDNSSTPINFQSNDPDTNDYHFTLICVDTGTSSKIVMANKQIGQDVKRSCHLKNNSATLSISS